jgi:hypothetical protein
MRLENAKLGDVDVPKLIKRGTAFETLQVYTKQKVLKIRAISAIEIFLTLNLQCFKGTVTITKLSHINTQCMQHSQV